MHIIAGKAVAFKEAASPEFTEYQKQIIKNAKALCDALTEKASGSCLAGPITICC